MKVVAYIMAKNEAETIGSCIDALQWCSEVVVADTGSSDDTVRISQEHGAAVVRVPFEGFGKTRNAAIEHIQADWIVCFDADEVCTPALAREIQSVISSDGSCAAYKAPRLNFLLGEKIRHSGWYPDYRHPVVFQPRLCRYSDDVVHERLVVQGTTGRLKEPFAHFSYRRLDQLLEKNRRYANAGSQKLVHAKKNLGMWAAFAHASASFFRHYVVKAGFLDGWAGFVIAVSSANTVFFKYAEAYETQHSLEQKDFTVPYSLR